MKPNKFQLLLLLFLCLTAYTMAQKKIVILHTNDTHSRIEPIPATDKHNANKGGVVRRKNYIDQVRRENKNVLVFDAGDFVQGTPYFNLFKGKVEIESMNRMRYDAVTLGNHEFDYGIEVLEKLVKAANSPIVCSNYQFEQPTLAKKIKPYIILKRDGIKIGIIGIGVSPNGLIAVENYKGMHFLPPVETANIYARKLKLEEKCDLVICLSHLGYEDDLKLAPQTENLDIIIGGHSHTYLEEPTKVKNSNNREVTIFQTSGRGAFVGRMDVILEKSKL